MIDTRGFTDKASKEKRYMELYENNDYVTAYSKHTDIRVKENPKWSIGRGDEWESHGELQRDFLKSQGMTENTRLLDIGCGVGRAARKIVPFLNAGHYVGIDISKKALKYAKELSVAEGWCDREPRFLLSNGMSIPVQEKFDIIWAHSVFTHLPDDLIRSMINSVKYVMAKNGKFLFTYKNGRYQQRTGLKQFRYPFSFFEGIASEFGLKAETINKIFPATQHTGRVLWGNTGVIR